MNLLDSIDAFLFDCDGVMWKGDALIDSVLDTLDMLQAMGKKLVFVTNNSTKSRKQYANKFHFLGIYVSEPKHIDNDYRSVAMKRRNKKIM
ncbi:hypothetical protein ACS0TY_022993 [Phlomoides rotata]